MTDFIVFVIRLTLLVIGLFIAYRVILMVIDIIRLVKRKKVVDELRRKFDVFSVEGEVLSFTSKRLSDLDTQYDISVSYTIDSFTYYKDVIIFNRGSLRVGQKITLLCDNDDYENVIVQDGEEEDALRRLIVRFAIMAIITIIFAWVIVRRTLSGMNDLVEILESMKKLFNL